MLLQKLDTTDDTYRMGSYVFCTPQSCQVKDDVSALSRLYSAVIFTAQPRALQLFYETAQKVALSRSDIRRLRSTEVSGSNTRSADFDFCVFLSSRILILRNSENSGRPRWAVKQVQRITVEMLRALVPRATFKLHGALPTV